MANVEQELATVGTFTGTIVPEGVPSSLVSTTAYRTRIFTLVLIGIVISVSAAWGAYRPEQVTLIIGFATMVITALFTSMKQEVAAAATAVKVEDVKQTLKESTVTTTEKLDAIQQTGEQNHTLLNSNMHLALADTLAALVEVATIAAEVAQTKPTAENKRRAKAANSRADVAREALRQHDEKQKVVDEGKKVIQDKK